MEGNDFKRLPRTEKWGVVRDHFYLTMPNSSEFTSSPAEHIQRHFLISSEWSPLRNFFFERLCAAEFHWFFVQGVDALMQGLYVPAVSSLFNGVEASLRVTFDQVSKTVSDDVFELSPYSVVSNKLIKSARDIGMPTHCLAFIDEIDFNDKLETQKPQKLDVEIVRLRNNICHGNILEFINRDLGEENYFFTPESLRELAFQLLDISGNWAENLGEFRKSKGFLHYDKK